MNNSVFNFGRRTVGIVMICILFASTACNNIINYGCKRTATHRVASMALAFTYSNRNTISHGTKKTSIAFLSTNPRSKTRTNHIFVTHENNQGKIRNRIFISLQLGVRMNSDDARSSIPSSSSFVSTTNTTNSTVAMTLHHAITTFEQHNVSEPIMSAVHLLAMAIQLPWETGYYHLLQIVNEDTTTTTNTNTNGIDPMILQQQSLSNRIVTPMELEFFHTLLQRRIHHEPIQYICGQWDFLDNTITIRPPLLCPRPETEELVLYAIQDLKTILRQKMIKHSNGTTQHNNNNAEMLHVLDIGCGTGCIGVTIVQQVPETYITAIDIEPIAITTSYENARRLQVYPNDRYEAYLCNIENFETEFMRKKHQLHDPESCEGKPILLYDMVVSNPPYILPSDMSTLELSVYNYESHFALNGGDSDGMKVIRTIIRTLPNICNVNAICWLEVDPSQPTLIEEFCIEQQQQLKHQHQLQHKANNNDNFTTTNSKVVQYVECIKDMFGFDRFVRLRIAEL
jgi:release factor glutamine methyltransferase